MFYDQSEREKTLSVPFGKTVVATAAAVSLTAALAAAPALMVPVAAVSAAPPAPVSANVALASAPLLIDINHTHDGILAVNNPDTVVVHASSVDEALALAMGSADADGLLGFSATGLDALKLNGMAGDIAALPGVKKVFTYRDPSAPGGILNQLGLVQASSDPDDPNVQKFLVVYQNNLLDDAPDTPGVGYPWALANSIATMVMVNDQSYKDGVANGTLQYILKDPDDPNKGYTAVILSQDLALTQLIRQVPIVGPTVATATAPALNSLVNSAYSNRNPDGTLTSYGENPGLKLPSLDSQVNLVKQLPGDVRQGLNDVQAQHQPPASDPVPDSDPEPSDPAPASDPEVSSLSSRNSAPQIAPPSAPQTNVVRGGLVAKPGQQFADAKKATDKVATDVEKTVKKATTGLNDAVKKATSDLKKAVSKLAPPKPHTSTGTGNSDSGDSGGSGSSGSGE